MKGCRVHSAGFQILCAASIPGTGAWVGAGAGVGTSEEPVPEREQALPLPLLLRSLPQRSQW